MAGHPMFDRGDFVIHTTDRALEEEIFGDSDSVSLDGDIKLRNGGTYIQKDVFSSSTVMVLVDFGRDVGTGVAAAWLYDKLKDKDVSIETAKGSYDQTKNGIQQALEDIAEEKNSDD